MFYWTTTGLIAYLIGALSWTSLALLVATSWKGRATGGVLLAAALLTAAWCWVETAVAGSGNETAAALSTIAESAAIGAWLVFLVRIWGKSEKDRQPSALAYRIAFWAVVLISVAAVAGNLWAWSQPWNGLQLPQSPDRVSRAALALVGLAFAIDTYHRADATSRWTKDHLLLGLIGLFSYQLLLLMDDYLLPSAATAIWELRGLVLAALAPLVAVSAARNREWSVQLFVSRSMVMFGVAFLGSATYMIAVTALGQFMRLSGGEWGRVAQLTFLVLSLAALLTVLISRQVRAKARVFIDKNFFSFRYDYRREWLRLIDTVFRLGDEDARIRSIRALAQLLDSPGGALWLRDSSRTLVYQAHWAAPFPEPQPLSSEDLFAVYLERSTWIIDLDEFSQEPERYPGLELPPWIAARPDIWLIVPLMLEEELIGFVLLDRPPTTHRLNWEDHDLLKTIGRQLSGYLALMEATEKLIEGRQFEGFNRLTAFLVHDLKNVSAQLGLVVSNAQKHKDNRAFVEDAIRTIENATGKINRLLDSLRKGVSQSERRPRLVELGDLLSGAVDEHTNRLPMPTVSGDGRRLVTSMDPEKFKSIIGHLIQNAQEASPADGIVHVDLKRDRRFAVLRISDSGAGMDEEFLRDRLFRPFDTTKGSAGMGIGAYESREFVRDIGGTMEVQSEPGKGTTFTLRIPCVEEAPNRGPSKEESDS